jgi:hypothetical protein
VIDASFQPSSTLSKVDENMPFGTLALFKALAGLRDQRSADTEGPGGKGDRRLDRKLAPEPARGIGGSLLGSVVDRGLGDVLAGHDWRDVAVDHRIVAI